MENPCESVQILFFNRATRAHLKIWIGTRLVVQSISLQGSRGMVTQPYQIWFYYEMVAHVPDILFAHRNLPNRTVCVHLRTIIFDF